MAEKATIKQYKTQKISSFGIKQSGGRLREG
jgi:hypothetical protein